MKKDPTHILVECPELIVSVKLGVLEPLKYLEKNGMAEVVFLATKDIRKEDIIWSDILITVRGCETLTRKIVCEAKRLGRFIIYYLDDDLKNDTIQISTAIERYKINNDYIQEQLAKIQGIIGDAPMYEIDNYANENMCNLDLENRFYLQHRE